MRNFHGSLLTGAFPRTRSRGSFNVRIHNRGLQGTLDFLPLESKGLQLFEQGKTHSSHFHN